MASKETTPEVPPIPRASGDIFSSSPFGKSQEKGSGSWDDLMSDIQAAEDAREKSPGFFGRARERISGLASRVKKLGSTALSAIGVRVEGPRSKSDNSRRIDLFTPDSEAGRGSVEDDQDRVSASAPESQSDASGEDDKSADSGEQDKKQKRELTEEEKWLLGQREKKVKSAEERLARVAEEHGEESDALPKIGRASCRERV